MTETITSKSELLQINYSFSVDGLVSAPVGNHWFSPSHITRVQTNVRPKAQRYSLYKRKQANPHIWIVLPNKCSAEMFTEQMTLWLNWLTVLLVIIVFVLCFHKWQEEMRKEDGNHSCVTSWLLCQQWTAGTGSAYVSKWMCVFFCVCVCVCVWPGYLTSR